ncbi:MAG: type IV pilus secretin PilQ [Gammaproteobacteria bacterium]|nr:type IV pilus secretin PilQ [Gammaproteobacteria bacterium]
MSGRVRRSLLSLLFLAPGAALAANPVTLQDMSFTSLPGDKMQVNLVFSGPVEQPNSFNVDEPPRIALDLANTKSALPWRSRRIASGPVKSVSAIEAGARTRVVINLVKQTAYTVKQQGHQIVLTLGGEAESTVQESDTKTETRQTTATSNSNRISQSTLSSIGNPGMPSIQQVDFRRGEKGEGRIFVTFSDPNIVIDVRQEGGKIVVHFMNTRLPEELHQRLDVVDFATPVQTIDTFSEEGNVRMVVAPTGEFEHLAYQSDNTLTIDIKPVEVTQTGERRQTEYKGEKLSLNFQDIEVRAVLQLLADFSGLNIVVSDSVQGNITLRLKNTPWDQALDIILKTKALAMRQNGNVILVAPGEEISERERLELEAQKQITELAPLRSELIQINYAKGSELADIIKSDKNTLLSDRGNITVDERTNTLLVRDTVEHIDEIRKLVSSLDIPIRQVLIESRIVIADDKFARDLGTRFGTRVNQGLGNGGDRVMLGGSTESLGLNPGTGASDFIPSPGNNLANDSHFNVNLPAVVSKGTPASFALGLLSGTKLLDLELSALQAEGRGELVSSPRVITSNQRKAVIEQGTEIPYRESSSSGATTTSFRKAVMSLEVTPQITPDDRIILDVRVSKDSVSSEVKGEGGAPAIDTNEVITQVLVDNGETVVLGGIYEQNKTVTMSKVPFLGDIPMLGWLFRSKSEINNKRELLIFVTPKILKEQFKLQ